MSPGVDGRGASTAETRSSEPDVCPAGTCRWPFPRHRGRQCGLFKVAMEVVPAANQTSTMPFATSSKTKASRSWGLVVGTLKKQ
jgi:hypothetical protein